MIVTEKLSKSYGNFQAVKDLNLIIKPGEIFCLLGANGAGKTSTINMLLGFIPASTGKILINGSEVNTKNKTIRKYIAYIPEVMMLYGHLTGIENLDFFSRLAGFAYSQQELTNFLDKVGLQKEAHHKRVSSYSKGMRQKVGIAIALGKNAQAVLMDEPTSGLDPKATSEFTNICKELSTNGKAILMATHDIFNAVQTGTHIGIMKQGSLVHTLSTQDITADRLQQLYLETI